MQGGKTCKHTNRCYSTNMAWWNNKEKKEKGEREWGRRRRLPVTTPDKRKKYSKARSLGQMLPNPADHGKNTR